MGSYQPHLRKEAGPRSWARVRASSWSVLARAAPIVLVTAALATTTRATWGSMIRAMARALGCLEPDLIGRPERRSERHQRCSACRHPWMSADLSVFEHGHLAEVAMDIKTYRTHPCSSRHRVGDGRANDNYGYVLAAQPGQSQGRPTTTAGSKPIVVVSYLRSPGNPGPGEQESSQPGTMAPGPIVVALQLPTCPLVSQPAFAVRSQLASGTIEDIKPARLRRSDRLGGLVHEYRLVA
jgi:hypothetical protein